jgi:hypothetical protein
MFRVISAAVSITMKGQDSKPPLHCNKGIQFNIPYSGTGKSHSRRLLIPGRHTGNLIEKGE